MTDLAHYWGNDISFSATGDFLTVDGVTETNQRILRGLLTAAPEYIFEPSYGAALGQYVGAPLTAEKYTSIKAAIRAVLSQDSNIVQTPAPTYDFRADAGGNLNVSIQYIYKPTGTLQTLSFNVSK